MDEKEGWRKRWKGGGGDRIRYSLSLEETMERWRSTNMSEDGKCGEHHWERLK